MEARSWQVEAIQTSQNLLDMGQNSALWEACPGAGKTTGSLLWYLKSVGNTRRRLVCVAPTRHIKYQWARSAHRLGVNINPNIASGRHLSRDYDGFCVTYDQLASNPSWVHMMSVGAFVILDEVHHAGNGLTWGTAVDEAFQNAFYVLALSGTAFRTDNNEIPYLNYVDDIARPDYRYSYSQAIQDGVCRPVAFVPYGGEVSWDDQKDGEMTSTLDAEGKKKHRARRLYVALQPESGWIERVLRDADQKLTHLRRRNIKAGGLVIGINQEHARKLADLLTTIAGIRPTLVLSDNSNASTRIKEFSKSSDKWIVACNMVSEGVDIPRLQVGVYATNIITKLYFRQFVGRLCRVTDLPGPQVGYCFLPSDPELAMHSKEVETEIAHIISNEAKPERKKHDGEWSEYTYKIRGGQNTGADTMILRGQQMTLFSTGTAVFDPRMIEELATSTAVETVIEDTPILAEQKAELSKSINQAVNAFCGRTGKRQGSVYIMLKQATDGVKRQKDCTVPQLQKRLDTITKWLRNA